MVIGRIILFYVDSEDSSENSPVFKGKIEYTDGSKDEVTLWKNIHPRVTKGSFYSGQVYHNEHEKNSK